MAEENLKLVILQEHEYRHYLELADVVEQIAEEFSMEALDEFYNDIDREAIDKKIESMELIEIDEEKLNV